MGSNDRFHWNLLLTSIEEGRVIPVIGPELLQLEIGGRQVSLYRLLAEQLVEALDVSADELAPDFGLNEVALRYLEDRGQRSVLYSTLHTLLQEQELPLPAPLQRLAEIGGLSLFVSTTFDLLLSRALDEVRFDGRPRTQSRVFSLRKRVEDLPGDSVSLADPLVFQIFGASSTAADYVVTDEDMLEFVFGLRMGERRPQLLFDALRDSNLLVLGCSFPNWLTRFFVRVVADMRLLDRRDTMETIADDRTPDDRNLVLFLRHCNVMVYEAGGTLEFIDELHRRWQERHPPRAEKAEAVAAPSEPEAEPMPGGGIFLSYASQDREAVLVLKEALEAAGLEVWFDQRRLEAGDNYERKIRRNIESCSYFFPIISQASAERIEGYYRKEWFWAIERAKRFDPSYPFLQPIVVDDTPYDTGGIPEEFSSRHWQVFYEGVPTDEFLELTRNRVRALRKRQAGRS